MKIERLELIHLRLPLVHFFETSFGRVEEKQTLIVRVEAEERVGYGECPAAAAPDFSYETVQTAWHILRDFLAPRIRGLEIGHPSQLTDRFRFVRGHPMAKAGIVTACYDLFAKAAGKPLWKFLGGTRNEVPTGISLGIEDTVPALLRRIEESLTLGYQRIKLKIKKGWDVDVLREVRRVFPSAPLTVDANAAYTLSDREHLCRLDEFGLLMIEQPLDHDDLLDHAELQKSLKTPICLDESLKTPELADRALAIGACRILNIKQARLGGTSEAIRAHDLAEKRGAGVWCGGLLESGIGRLHNVALATLPNFRTPGDISASSRYWKEEIVDPPVEVTSRGFIRLSDEPGLGAAVREDRFSRYLVRREHVLS